MKRNGPIEVIWKVIDEEDDIQVLGERTCKPKEVNGATLMGDHLEKRAKVEGESKLVRKLVQEPMQNQLTGKMPQSPKQPPRTFASPEKIPWFLQPSYGGARSEKERSVAETLLALKTSVPTTAGNSLAFPLSLSSDEELGSIGWKNISESQKIAKKNLKYKRNLNACLEHRRRHQRCPNECPSRKNEQIVFDQQLPAAQKGCQSS